MPCHIFTVTVYHGPGRVILCKEVKVKIRLLGTNHREVV